MRRLRTAFVAMLQSGEGVQPLVLSQVRGRLTLAVVMRPYGDGMRLVLTQDITERERAEAMPRHPALVAQSL